MATHSSIVAWKSPWTEEPGGVQFWSQKELDMTEHRSSIFFVVTQEKFLLATADF